LRDADKEPRRIEKQVNNIERTTENGKKTRGKCQEMKTAKASKKKNFDLNALVKEKVTPAASCAVSQECEKRKGTGGKLKKSLVLRGPGQRQAASSQAGKLNKKSRRRGAEKAAVEEGSERGRLAQECRGLKWHRAAQESGKHQVRGQAGSVGIKTSGRVQRSNSTEVRPFNLDLRKRKTKKKPKKNKNKRCGWGGKLIEEKGERKKLRHRCPAGKKRSAIG